MLYVAHREYRSGAPASSDHRTVDRGANLRIIRVEISAMTVTLNHVIQHCRSAVYNGKSMSASIRITEACAHDQLKNGI